MKNPISTRPKWNNRGFGLISTLALMPILMVLMAGIASVMILSHRKSLGQGICREGVLTSARYLADSANNLFELNPLAAQLRLESKIAEHEVRAARGFPPAMPAAIAHLTNVRMRQAALRVKQRLIISSGTLQSAAAIQKMKSRFSKDGYHITETPYPKLHVRQSPADPFSPSYEPMPPFENRMFIRTHWYLSTDNWIPAGLKNWFQPTDQMIGACGATLIQKKEGVGKWEETLKADKSY